MSGDVQPRKRKDKKKKKDDLGVEEPRGTSAKLGEGDVFMHSYHEHGTGGHWCAKIIFFSLLAVLVTLIGLIILENRGLTELEANSVESRYSGVLEGWIEDATDDHHDEHTLELKHHDDDEDHPDDQLDENEAEDESLEEEINHNDEDEESNEDEIQSEEMEDENETQNDDDDNDEVDEIENDEDESQNNEEEGENHNNDDEEQDEDSDDEDDVMYNEEIEENFKDNEDDEEEPYENYSYEEISHLNNINDDNEDDDDEHDEMSKEMSSHYGYHESYENNDNKETKHDESESIEHNIEDEENEDDDQGDDEDEQEIEKIEKEIFDVSEEVVDNYASASREKRETSKEAVEEDDEPPVEKISRPQAGKPYVEIEEETPVKPVDTLAEEEAYEREQEELRRQEENAPHSLWLKLCVGGALLAATHALVRRSRADVPENEETITEESPSLTDRRMTIIEEPMTVPHTSLSRAPRQIVDEEVFKKPAPVAQSVPIAKPRVEEEIVKEMVTKVLEIPKSDAKKEEEKELYSEEEEDEDVEEDNEIPQKDPANKQEAEESEAEAEPEEVSDVEIIYDETVEEEEIPEEEIEEEEISDVDDTELLSRLEAKYGRLPEPERPGQYKGGGNSLEADWPGEPTDPYWRTQLDTAEEEFRQGRWRAAARRAGGGGLAGCGRARWLRAAALDRHAELHRDNRALGDAIAAYLHLLKMNEALSDRRLLEVALRTVDRIYFRGTYINAEPVYRLLIRRFPDDVNYRNNLTVTYLMANRADLADEVLRETLRLWPNDRVALAHRGFVLKIHYNKLEEAVQVLRKALDGDAGRANEPRFYYHLGDALLMLGRFEEAHEVHKRGAELGHFLSPSQRSLYNVPRLRARPWWRVEDTPYVELAGALESSWRDILREGEAAVALYEQEKEGLRERGEWSQLDIFVRGREVEGRCARAPAVCAALRSAAAGCRRGQVKFSMMTPGTHVRPHVGPTNCRLRMHLALSNTEGTYLRVDKETRQWQLGKVLIFDDSFEHEVWHNGTGARLVLIVDVWHPDLTAAERRQLPAI